MTKQQEEMLKKNTHKVEERIVSLRQPQVRPIVRGKAGAPVEFGQKLAFAVVNGFTFIDRWSWDNFSEGNTLIESAERYKERHGFFPKVIWATVFTATATIESFARSTVSGCADRAWAGRKRMNLRLTVNRRTATAVNVILSKAATVSLNGVTAWI